MEHKDICKILKSIDDKLSVITGEIVRHNSENATIKELVDKLHKRGIDNENIAAILGITVGHVSKEKSIANRGKSK